MALNSDWKWNSLKPALALQLHLTSLNNIGNIGSGPWAKNKRVGRALIWATCIQHRNAANTLVM